MSLFIKRSLNTWSFIRQCKSLNISAGLEINCMKTKSYSHKTQFCPPEPQIEILTVGNTIFRESNLRYYSDHKEGSLDSPEDKEASNQENVAGSKKKTLEKGVVITDLSVGSGAVAKSGKTISVYYSGKLKSTNKIFDENASGPGLTFRLGRGDVIEGWDVGVVGMKVGGKRVITCPPAMAYGAKGYPPVIPPNSTLIFEVELKDVK